METQVPRGESGWTGRVETLRAVRRFLSIMAEELDKFRRRAQQLRTMLGSVTDPRAIEVIQREIATLETKARELEASQHEKA